MITSNETIFALNYFSINQTCQLFYTNISSILIQFNFNATLIFINQSIVSTKYNQITYTSQTAVSTSSTPLLSSTASSTTAPVAACQ
ncbi:unnamed protein product, partial [Adineta steineri]